MNKRRDGVSVAAVDADDRQRFETEIGGSGRWKRLRVLTVFEGGAMN